MSVCNASKIYIYEPPGETHVRLKMIAKSIHLFSISSHDSFRKNYFDIKEMSIVIILGLKDIHNSKRRNFQPIDFEQNPN